MPCCGEISVINRIGAEELSLEWRIENFLSLPGGSFDFCESPRFKFCGSRWRLRLHPNKTREGQNPASVEIDLLRLTGGPPKTFRISVGIRGSYVEEKRKEVEKKFTNDEWWEKFCWRPERDLCRAYNLTVTCVMVSSAARDEENLPKRGEESEIPRKLQGLEELQKSLQNMLRSGDDSDIIIKVQGKEFPAHRALLRARSPVFQAMFTHDMVEKQKGVITMEDCDPDTFPDFLEHVYTGSVEMISPKNVVSLYTASDMYDLKTLKQECTHFMKNNLTVAFFCDVITLAVKHGEKELTKRATEFFCDNTLEIVKTVEWQIFLKENTTVGNELLIKVLRK